MITEIKVQVPLSTNAEVSYLLIYDKERKYFVNPPVDSAAAHAFTEVMEMMAETHRQPELAVKCYFEVEVDEDHPDFPEFWEITSYYPLWPQPGW